MQKYIKNYLDSHGYDENTFISCENCNSNLIVDIHHIEPRSKFGSKTKAECDDASNLIALCRRCHQMAHAGKLSKEYLLDRKK